mmetsp:Transcript_17357/g.54904  ORF Transcript_17357/g.54904 Transcript_17357/m.54904 type:complete len:215 (+) Transcript_17357:500-1144(+)
MDEVAGLEAVAQQCHAAVGGRAVGEDGEDTRVRRGRVLAVAIDVEESHSRCAMAASAGTDRLIDGGLVCAVVRDGPDGVALADGNAFGHAVDCGTAGKDHRAWRVLEEGHRGVAVDPLAALGVRLALRHRGDGSQVEDRAHAVEHGLALLGVRDAALDQLRTSGQGVGLARGEVVQDDHAGAGLGQCGGQVPPNEAGTARHADLAALPRGGRLR